MAVAAERNRASQTGWLIAQEAFPEVERRASERQQRFLGELAVKHLVEEPGEVLSDSSFLATIKSAAAGSVEDEWVLEKNISSDISERMYKVGPHKPTCVKFIDGTLQQKGKKLTDTHRNTLEHTTLIPEMYRLAAQELKNVLVIEELQPTGILETHDVIFMSPSSTSMTDQQKKDYNFFLDTESCSIQRFSASGDDVELEVAFVAGKQTPGSSRKDIQTIQKITEKYGVPIRESDSTEICGQVFLVPKEEISNGVIDVVKMWDDEQGGTFYGQAKHRQDYLEHRQERIEKIGQFDKIVQHIKAQLISEANTIDSPFDAILRLDELSGQHCVGYAVNHQEIETAIFGPTAALHIEEARFFMERGEHDRAKGALISANQTQSSGSCPLFKGSLAEGADSNNPSSGESSGKKLMSCPYCKAKVFDDPCAKVLCCRDCKAKVVNRRVVNKGDGGSKARDKRAAEKRKEEAELAKQVDAVYEESNLTEETFSKKAKAAAQIVKGV